MNKPHSIEDLIFQKKYKAAREEINNIDDPITRNCWLAFFLALSSKNIEAFEKIKLMEQVELQPEQALLLHESKVLIGIKRKYPLENLQEEINYIEQQQTINPIGISLLGSFYWRKKNFEKTNFYFKKLIQIFPVNFLLTEMVISMLLQFKKQKEAREYNKKINPSLRRMINSYILAWPNLFWPQLATGMILALLTLVIKFPYNLSVLTVIGLIMIYFRIYKYGLAFAFSLSQLGIVIMIIMYQFFRLPFMN